MAMYEDKGYCPNNAFLHYGMNGSNEVSALWEKTKSILGDRTGYMVYSEAGCNYQESYIVDALEGAKGTLGVEVATALKQLIPVCKYAEEGRMIICTDLINPYQIPAKIGEYDGKWSLCIDDDPVKTLLFEDERYLVAIQDEGEAVHIYLFKK